MIAYRLGRLFTFGKNTGDARTVDAKRGAHSDNERSEVPCNDAQPQGEMMQIGIDTEEWSGGYIRAHSLPAPIECWLRVGMSDR